MANWVEGNLRIRGTKTNIKNFLKNEIVCIVPNKEDICKYVEKKPVLEKEAYRITIYHQEANGSYYIRNTYRNFFFTDQIEIAWPDDRKGEVVIYIDNFNVAWSFKKDGWVEHAVKYGIDFKMFGFEQGMEFSQVMTVSRDGTANIETKEYNDWTWDCPFPNMGG